MLEAIIVGYLLVGALVLRGRRARAIVTGRGKGKAFCLAVGCLVVWPVVVIQ